MPNIRKIDNEIEKEVKEMVFAGYHAEYIGKKIGVNSETIRNWAKRTGTILSKRRSVESLAKEKEFVKLMLEGGILKQVCKFLDIWDSQGIEWANKNGISHLIRSKKEAAIDRQINIEELNSRIPKGHGVVINREGYYCTVRTPDGYEYKRPCNQLFRGDPRFSKGSRIIDESTIAENLKKIGYDLIPGSFKNKKTPIQAIHSECGQLRNTVFYQFNKKPCKTCSNTGISREETNLNSWISSLGLNSQKFHFSKEFLGKGRGKEIDIFIPELKIGIEYCGLYFHGEGNSKQSLRHKKEKHEKNNKTYVEKPYDNARFRHKIKMEMCQNKSFELVTIFEHEWLKRQTQVKSFLKSKLGKNERKIGARNTEVKEVLALDAKKFLNDYHIQGAARIKIAYGLFQNDELLAVVTGAEHHRNAKEFVLNRLCFKTDVSIAGGASKLNKQLEIWAKNNGFEQIKTWSDNRWSQGRVYLAMGYELYNNLPPDYIYFDSKKNVFSKQSCKKENLIKKGGVGNTESELAQSLGLDRIWDCGKKCWIKRLI